MRLFVDSWGWLAQEDRREAGHSAAVRCFQERCTAPGRIVTSDYVLDEMITRLFQRRPFNEAWEYVEALLESASQRYLSIERVTPARFQEALQFRRRYSDKPRISFTDLTTLVIMQELRIRDILTADHHFEQVGLDLRTLPH